MIEITIQQPGSFPLIGVYRTNDLLLGQRLNKYMDSGVTCFCTDLKGFDSFNCFALEPGSNLTIRRTDGPPVFGSSKPS